MSLRSVFDKYGAGAALYAAALPVFAAVPAEVTTSMTDMKADAITVATGFLVAVIAIAAFKLMRSGK